ncbi:MAG: ChbG/HpnK family deacetylase [Treponema sp.]|nr:ChbG/HpnK family deacetylase [Treponema sp.]
MNKNIIDIHADDYGLSKQSDNDILTLCQKGKLDSISIIPNLDIFPQSVSTFLETRKDFYHIINVSIHLNFMEGKAISPLDLVPDLVDSEGYFTVTWARLFLWNYNLLKRQKIKFQLKTEIAAQINKCIAAKIVDPDFLRIDSHQHPHMIPLVFDALTEAISENNFKVTYIRNTNDPLSFYLLRKGSFKGLSIANVLKCLILNFYSIKVTRWLKQKKLKNSYLCGVFYSGKMDDRIFSVLPVFEKKSSQKNRVCEVLFHPGLMDSSEITEEFKKTGFNDFHLSENRKIEYNTCEKL